MNVVEQVITASLSGDQEKFDHLLTRMGYEFCPVQPNITSPLMVVLGQAKSPQEFISVCHMTWASHLFSEKEYYPGSLQSDKNKIEYSTQSLLLCMSAAFHNEKMDLIPDLVDDFVSQFVSQTKISTPLFNTNIVRVWMSKEKFLDWENNIAFYERLSSNTENCDTQVLVQAGKLGNLSVIEMLYKAGRVPHHMTAHFAFAQVNNLRFGPRSQFCPSVFSDRAREVAKMGGHEMALKLLMDSSDFPSFGVENTTVGKLINHLKSKAEPEDCEYPLQALLDLIDVPNLSAKELEFFQLLRSNAPSDRFPFLHAFVGKHELLQEIDPSRNSPAARKMM